jgi:hypothetical protein
MAINLSVESEIGPAIAWTGRMMAQLPFATSQALNRTAYQIQQGLNYETTRYFDKPTAFTKRAFRFTKSTKANLEVVVGAAQLQGRYLRFGIQGGARPAKGFERKFLQSIVDTGSIPANAQLRPTRYAPTNAQGNVSLSALKRIQAGLNGGARGGFFYGTPRGGGRNAGKPLGIYRRSREQLFPYFYAEPDRATYRPQFPILKLGTDKAQQVFGGYLRSSLAEALRTAR